MKKIDYKTIIPILAIAIIQTVFAIVVTNKVVELENKMLLNNPDLLDLYLKIKRCQNER